MSNALSVHLGSSPFIRLFHSSLNFAYWNGTWSLSALKLSFSLCQRIFHFNWSSDALHFSISPLPLLMFLFPCPFKSLVLIATLCFHHLFTHIFVARVSPVGPCVYASFSLLFSLKFIFLNQYTLTLCLCHLNDWFCTSSNSLYCMLCTMYSVQCTTLLPNSHSLTLPHWRLHWWPTHQMRPIHCRTWHLFHLNCISSNTWWQIVLINFPSCALLLFVRKPLPLPLPLSPTNTVILNMLYSCSASLLQLLLWQILILNQQQTFLHCPDNCFLFSYNFHVTLSMWPYAWHGMACGMWHVACGNAIGFLFYPAALLTSRCHSMPNVTFLLHHWNYWPPHQCDLQLFSNFLSFSVGCSPHVTWCDALLSLFRQNSAYTQTVPESTKFAIQNL